MAEGEKKRHTFSWFPQFTDAVMALPMEERGRWITALCQYGTDGVAMSFDGEDFDGTAIPGFAWSSMFAPITEQVDHSVDSRENNKGGRPRKNPPKPKPEPEPEQETEVPAVKTPVSETGNPGFAEGNTGFESAEPGFEGFEKPETFISTNLYCSELSYTEQEGESSETVSLQGGGGRVPPTIEEVREFFDLCGCPQRMADKFFYHFDGKKPGWEALRDWRSRARGWMMDEASGTFPGAPKRGDPGFDGGHDPGVVVSDLARRAASAMGLSPAEAQRMIDDGRLKPTAPEPADEGGYLEGAELLDRISAMTAKIGRGGEG